MNKVFPPRGMRDILPADKKKRDKAISVLTDVYTRFGFTPIETPALESITALKSKDDDGGENESLLFEVLKRGLDESEPIKPKEAIDLGLRYDLTLPLSRFYATNHASLPNVFKVLQFDYVWRAERPQKGRYRQFKQCDIDIIGEQSNVAETQLIIATMTALKELGITQTKLLINDRRIINSIFASLDIDDEYFRKIIIALDKREKIGKDELLKELEEYMPGEVADTMLNEIEKLQSVDLAGDIPTDIATDVSPIENLKEIFENVKSVLPEIKIEFNPFLMRGMGYYTGAIFEVAHEEFSYSIAGGGRYDKVIGKFLNKEVPACGFSIGFERIINIAKFEDDDNDKKSIAIIYEKNSDPKRFFKLQKYFFAEGTISSPIKMPRKMNSVFWQSLSDTGYTHALILRNDNIEDTETKIIENNDLSCLKELR